MLARLRLRTRLALAFALVALAPLAVLVPWSSAHLRSALQAELDARTEHAVATTQAAIDQRGQDVRRAVDALAQSAAIEQLARDVHRGADLATAAPLAERLMGSRGLTVLAILDDSGRTLSSGHLPARVGDRDPALLALAHSGTTQARFLEVEIQAQSGLAQVPALVSAAPVDYGDLRLWVVGGERLDATWAQSLAQLTGASVALQFPDQPAVSTSLLAPPRVERALPLGAGTVTLSFSRAAIDRAERSVRWAFFAISLLALAGAALLGALIARRITRPVEALSEGARRVSQGDWTEVRAEATGEVGALVQAFNQMTSELSRTTHRLVAAERVAAWQEIAKGLAHELKNPLTPIQMSLETLLAAHGGRSPLFEQMFDESAAAMLEEVERLRRTIDAFSRFARLPKPERATFELADWARQALSLYAAPPAGISLSLSLSPGLAVSADRDQLTQVLINLIKNAEEAMPEGGRIDVRARRDGAQAILEVEDQGPGIPPEKRARIFEPYFTTKSQGTGLGLAICARIAQEHGGALAVDGAPGAGARFTLTLPLVQPAA